MKDFLSIILPFPPTVNHYWRRTEGHRTALTKKALAFRDDTLAAILEQLGAGWRGHIAPDQRVAMTIDAYPPDRRRRDLDNLLKPTLDALQHAGLFDDDSQVDDLRIVRQMPEPRGPGCLVVKVKALK